MTENIQFKITKVDSKKKDVNTPVNSILKDIELEGSNDTNVFNDEDEEEDEMHEYLCIENQLYNGNEEDMYNSIMINEYNSIKSDSDEENIDINSDEEEEDEEEDEDEEQDDDEEQEEDEDDEDTVEISNE